MFGIWSFGMNITMWVNSFQLRNNPMNTALIAIGSIAAIVGIGVATWSIITTKKSTMMSIRSGNAGQTIKGFSKT